MIKISLENKGVEELIKKMNCLKDVEKTKILEQTAIKVKTKISESTSSKYYINAKDVNEAIKIIRPSKESVYLKVRGRRFSMSRFNVIHSRSSPLKVEVIRGQQKVLKRGYLAYGKHGIEHVFKRKYADGERYPIRVVRSLSIPQMLGSKEAIKTFEKEAFKEIEDKMERILRGI